MVEIEKPQKSNKSLKLSDFKDQEPKTESKALVKFSKKNISFKNSNLNVGHLSKKNSAMNYISSQNINTDSSSNTNPNSKKPSNTTTNKTNNFFFNQMTLEFEEKFLAYYKTHFIDSAYNQVGYYEEYLIQNLKVIKNMQFFFNESTYDSSFSIIQDKISSLNIDYSQPYLIFDLDETLIHTEEFVDGKPYYSKIVLQSDTDFEQILGMYLRPYAIELLEFAKGKFKLLLLTAAQSDYAIKVLRAAKLDGYFDYVLDREYCIKVKDFYIKDVTVFNTSFNKLNCILIDNNIYSFAPCLNQGTLVSSFFNDMKDEELKDLMNYIETILIPNSSDIITANNNYYMYHEIMLNLNLESEENFDE